MTTKELLKKVAERTGYNPDAVTEIYSVLTDEILKHLDQMEETESIKLKGIGSLRIVNKKEKICYPPRDRRNPVKVPARKDLRLVPTIGVKQRLNRAEV